MGLDTYAVVRGDGGVYRSAPDGPFDGLRLVGGMYSGGVNSSSIRGKVYERVVAAATGESLYQRRIEPDVIAEMAVRLRTAVEDAKRVGIGGATRERGRFDQRGKLHIESDEIAALEVAGHEIDAQEAEHLAQWFEICAERGYAVEGWW